MAKFRIGAAVALVALAPHPALAEAEPPVCTAAGTLPPELSAWSMLVFRDAATSPSALDQARLVPGEASRVTLAPMARVTFPLHPEKTAAADSYGGLLQLVVPARGTYRVVLGSRAWIDMVAPAGQAVPSIAHTMGPACTGIRKMVDFALAPGHHTLQLSGNPTTEISVLVLRQP